MPQSDLVLFNVDSHVALITVNDPDRRNAVTEEMSRQLRAAVERAEADPGVHAVVVTGAVVAGRRVLGLGRHDRLPRLAACARPAPSRCSLGSLPATTAAAHVH